MSPWLQQVAVYADRQVWVEPFGGDAGAGLRALADDAVEQVIIAEANPALAAFWSVLTGDHADALIGLVSRTRAMTLDDFYTARDNILTAERGEHTESSVSLAFHGFVVNRCSRSGMVAGNVGPIGGKEQSGKWGVGARWNPDALAARLRLIRDFGDRLRVHAGDGVGLIEELNDSGIADETLLFVDPPCLGVGNSLYRNGMQADDHAHLASALADTTAAWVLTYDADPRVLELYPDAVVHGFGTRHTAHTSKQGVEYLVTPEGLPLPTGNPMGRGVCRQVQGGQDVRAS